MPASEAAPGAANVFLVGAGPGDPGLMTRRALELIARADAILYDRLIPHDALHGARDDADLRYVGKEPGRGSMPQREINALLVELGRSGRTVVRLKGGDPFVFGRGGEEAQALADAGLAFEIVPGVTAGLSAPAYAGIPVTHRDAASAVALVTGHEDVEKDDSSLNWNALGAFRGTLVLYMGVGRLAAIAERLREAGRSGEEPVAVIERGTLPVQRTVTGTLADIAERAAAAGVEPPAVTVVGPVAELHDALAWLERRPLHGLGVVVTRARAQASGLAARLAELGAAVVETPVIRIEPRPLEGRLADAVERIGDYGLVCLTSTNGAELLMDALAATGRDARALVGALVAAIGPGTATALSRRGVRPDVVPERSTAEALVDALAEVEVRGLRTLVARAADARDLLPDALAARGAEVEVVPLYDTVAEPLSQDQLSAIRDADYVTFTSSSTVRFLFDALAIAGQPPPAGRVVSIGPVTSATAREHDLTVHAEATRHDVDGLIDALVADARVHKSAAPA